GPAVDQRRRSEAQANAFDQRRQVPRVDELAVDRRLAAHRVEPRAVDPGWGERVAGKQRIEACDDPRGALERGSERRRQTIEPNLSVVRYHENSGVGASNTLLIDRS